MNAQCYIYNFFKGILVYKKVILFIYCEVFQRNRYFNEVNAGILYELDAFEDNKENIGRHVLQETVV